MKKVLLTAVATLSLTTATIAQTVPSYVPTNGLVGWWPFNGNANDESGNGNNGTVNGTSLTSDRDGNTASAYSFYGVNDYIEILTNNLMFDSQNFTISFWLKTNQGGTSANGGPNVNPAIISRLDNGGPTQNYPTSVDNFVIYEIISGMLLNTNNAGSAGFGSGSIILNTWQNFIITKENGITSSYLNSQYLGSGSVNNNPVNYQPFPIRFGRSKHAYWKDFSGELDDIGYWNRALTQQEVTDLYNAVNCNNNLAITPQTNTLQIGNTATFNATTSDANPTYVWQSDFGQGFQTLNNYGNYIGVNTNTLSIANVQLVNHNQPIRAISTSGICVDTSNVAYINIADTCITTTNETIYDTTFVTITDTNYVNQTIYDTTFVTVTDTNYVTVYDTVTNYISVTDTLFINVNTVGLNNTTIVNTIKVFPNPTNSHLNLDFGNFNNLNGYSIKIYNSLSQVIYNQAITQQSETIDLSTFGGNGIYFLHVINAQNNTVEIRKIVLQ